MPIVRMASKREQIPAGAANIRNVTEQWKNHCSDPAHYELWLYDTHVGLCLEDREHNFYDDSDFYMVVWNPETNKPESIEFASTRGWSYPCLASHVDASEEIRAKYDAYKAGMAAEHARQHAEALAKKPAKGKTLRVVKGRKVPVGTTGLCIWFGNNAYGERVGIKTESGEVHWTASSNVEVVLPD